MSTKIKTLAVAAMAVLGSSIQAAYVVWEAEDFDSSFGTDANKNFAVMTDTGFTTSGDVIGMNSDGSTVRRNNEDNGVSYSLTFTETGVYNLHYLIRIDWTSGGNTLESNPYKDADDDSFYAAQSFGSTPDYTQIDIPSINYNSGETTAEYNWELGATSLAITVTSDMLGTPQEFRVTPREDGLLIDAFVFSSDATADTTGWNNTLAAAQVPEPSTAILVFAVSAFAILRRRR